MVLPKIFPNCKLNPFKMNGISHFYQLDQSISALRVVGWNFFFHFYSNFNRTTCKQTGDPQSSVVSDLGLHCLLMSLI